MWVKVACAFLWGDPPIVLQGEALGKTERYYFKNDHLFALEAWAKSIEPFAHSRSFCSFFNTF